jgi:hypothetical protein
MPLKKLLGIFCPLPLPAGNTKDNAVFGELAKVTRQIQRGTALVEQHNAHKASLRKPFWQFER